MFNQTQKFTYFQHSLQADLVTGWKPKLKIVGPMPLNFDNPAVDKSIMALIHQQSAFYQIVYLGVRPISTFKMHQIIAKNYKYKYNYLLHNDFGHLRPFFKKFCSQFEPEVKRPFYGMNPSISKRELVFDSCFQGGNLDCVVRLKTNQYDLILRVDSNTSGHILWYYFRIKNPQQTQKLIKLNIVNLRKTKSAYQRGMRPFVKREGTQWQQEGENVFVSQEKLRYQKQNLSMSIEDNLQPIYFRKLSFELTLKPKEDIQLAYCIPYTYSQLLQDIRYLRKKSEIIEGLSLEVDFSNQSLSGLEIPVLKLRHGNSGNGKYCAFIIGRQHPGQSNASYTLKGSLQQLLSGSEQSLKMLKCCDFVIIPILNPDGVVCGNFRTSLFGKDLNRLFKTKDTTLLPEIQMARTIFTQLSETYKKKLILFLDYHGHSTRKNAFILGPGIFDAQMLNDIRILPKLMAQQTEIFRFPSCSFRLDENKKTTARALFGKLAGLSYTIQCSNWSFYSQKDGKVYDFTAKLWEQLGVSLMKAVEQFLMIKSQSRKKFQQKVIKKDKSKPQLKLKSRSQRQTNKIDTNIPFLASHSHIGYIRTYTDSKINQSQQYQQTPVDLDHVEVKQANQSDQMSEKGMDTDSQGEDMEKEKFKKYIRAASEMLIQFQKMYYGDQYKKGFSKYKMNSKSNKLLLEKKQKPQQPIQACLRSKDKKQQYILQSEQVIQKIKKKNILQNQVSFRESIIKNKSESKHKLHSISKGLEPERKAMVKASGLIRQQLAFTDELKRFEMIQKLELERSVENIRKTQKGKYSKQSKQIKPLYINFPKTSEFNLPIIKNSKHQIEQTSLIDSMTKSRDQLNDLIIAQQNINRSSVFNILKLSKIQKDKNHYF